MEKEAPRPTCRFKMCKLPSSQSLCFKGYDSYLETRPHSTAAWVLMVLIGLAVATAIAVVAWPCPIQALQVQGVFNQCKVRRATSAGQSRRRWVRRRQQPASLTSINMISQQTATTSSSSAASPYAAETTYVGGKRVVHIATQQAWLEEDVVEEATIADIISQEAAVSVDRAVELVRFGAVYMGEAVDSSWKSTARNHRTGTSDGATTVAAASKMAAKAASQPPFRGTSFEHMRLRRLEGSEALAFPPAGSYLRVHCDPRTFPAAQKADWTERIVDVTNDYVVMDKPTGVPSVPTIDNVVENALYQTRLALAKVFSSEAGSLDAPSSSAPLPPLKLPSLNAVSRLDVCTSGLIIFARNKPATATLNQIFRDRQVFKRYLALLTPGPALEVGPTAHCCRSKAFDGQRRPRIYADFDVELLEGEKWGGGWQEARSTILLCAPATGSAAAAAVADDRAETKAAVRTPATAAREGEAARLEADLVAGLDSGSSGADDVAGEEEATSMSAATAFPGLEEPLSTATEEDCYPPHLCAIQLETGRTHQLRLQLAAMGAAVAGDTRYRGVVGRVHGGTPEDDRTDLFGQEPDTIMLQAARIDFEWRDKRVTYTAARPSWALDDV